MPQLYCGPCWTSSGQRTPATWDIESDLFCDAHKQSLGYDASEGNRIGRADAISSAAPAKAIERAMPLMSRMVRDAAAAEPAAVVAGAPKSWDEFKERSEGKYIEIRRKLLALAAGGCEEFTCDDHAVPIATFANRMQNRVRTDPELKRFRWSIRKLPHGVSVTRVGLLDRSLDEAAKKALLPKPLNVPRRTKEPPAMGLRTCSVPGCDRYLNAVNKSGRCANHFYVPTKERQDAKVAGTKRVAPPSKTDSTRQRRDRHNLCSRFGTGVLVGEARARRSSGSLLQLDLAS